MVLLGYGQQCYQALVNHGHVGVWVQDNTKDSDFPREDRNLAIL